MKLLYLLVNAFIFNVFKWKRETLTVKKLKPTYNVSCGIKTGGFIFYIDGKQKVISKADEFFVRTCEEQQLNRILNGSESTYPIYPFFN